MVGRSTESFGRCTHLSSCSQYSCVHRCLPKGLRGAHLNDIVLSGHWSSNESQFHINVLELKAVLLALKGFQDHLKAQRVLIYSDKNTVVSYLNKEGGTYSIQTASEQYHQDQTRISDTVLGIIPSKALKSEERSICSPSDCVYLN